MATFNKFNSFVEAVAEKTHNLGADSLMVALTNAANPPLATNTQLVNLTEIAYTYCSSRAITRTSSGQTGGVYKLVLQDLVLTATGGSVGPFQHVVIYNDTAAGKELIGWYSYPSEITLLENETLTIDFSEADGVLQLS